MTMFGIRYDLRCPAFGSASSAELAAALLDQCEWADRLGFVNVTRKIENVQIGFLNFAENGFLPVFPFFNLPKN